MTELAILMFMAIVLAWCADHVTVQPLNGRKMHREVLFSIILFVLLAGFVGLRKWYNDTETYRYAYEAMNTFPAYWEEIKLELGSNFGFGIINARSHFTGFPYVLGCDCCRLASYLFAQVFHKLCFVDFPAFCNRRIYLFMCCH